MNGSTARKGFITLCAAMVLGAGSLGASAGTEADAEIVDPTGDANHLHPVPDPDPNTTPASVAAVDLVKVWFGTKYTTVKDRDAAGKVLRVRRISEALEVSMQTAGPKRVGAFLGGYTLQYQVHAKAEGGCGVFYFWISIDPETGAVDDVQARCGSPTVVLPPTSVTFSGNTFKLTAPFALVPFLSAGRNLIPEPTSARAAWLLNNSADVTVGGRSFVIGSDVPADVDCVTTPAHPEC